MKNREALLFLDHLFDGLEAATSADDLARLTATLAVECCGEWALILLRDDEGRLRLAGAHHRDRECLALLRRLGEGWPAARNHLLARQADELARPAVWRIEDEASALALFGSRQRARLASRTGSRSVLLAPLIWRQRRLGLLAIGAARGSSLSDGMVASEARALARGLGITLTQRRRVETVQQVSQQLTLTSLRLQAVLENVPQGLLVTDAPDGHIVSANQALLKLSGRPVDPAMPASRHAEFFSLARPTGEPFAEDAVPWVRALRTGQPTPAEEMVVGPPGGRRVTVLGSAAPILDEARRVVGAVALWHDISERVELERQKDEFLAIAAHELRTPVTSIKGFSQLLERRARKRPDFGEAELGMLERLNRQVDRLIGLIAGLLDYSRLQLGQMDLQRFRFSLGRLAEQTLSQLQVVTPDRQWRFMVSGETEVEGDPARIEQVLTNLLANAIKATVPGGIIDVSVRQEGRSVWTAVRDDGAGMSPETQRHIFERLYRAPDRAHEGMGLGLYVSQGIVNRHGGEIWFESEEGKGTTFTFSLPLAPRSAGEQG